MPTFADWAETAGLGLLHGLYGSAHVMGGAAMGADATRRVVGSDGRHWLSIYGLAIRNATRLARDLT